MSRGGRRKGAGRPRGTQEPLRTLNVRFSAEQLGLIDQLAERDSLPRTTAVRAIVEWVRKNVQMRNL